MSFTTSLLIITAIFSASLGLNLNSVALMSGHALSQKTSRQKLNRLLLGFLVGVISANFLLISAITLFTMHSFALLNLNVGLKIHETWHILQIGIIVQAVIMLLFVIRNAQNPNPWVIKPVRSYLRKRCLKTTSVIEAINLGVMSVLAHTWLLTIPFITLAFNALTGPNLGFIFAFSLLNGLPTLLIIFAIRLRIKISQIHLFLLNRANFLHFLTFFSLIVIELIIMTQLMDVLR